MGLSFESLDPPSGMLQTISTERRAAGGDRPRSGCALAQDPFQESLDGIIWRTLRPLSVWKRRRGVFGRMSGDPGGRATNLKEPLRHGKIGVLSSNSPCEQSPAANWTEPPLCYKPSGGQS